MPNLLEGTRIEDRYEIIAKLGDGGMGSVFKAIHLGLERVVAIKFLHDHLLDDEENRLRFEREGKTLAKISHSNIMAFYEFGFYQEQFPFIAMEYLAGTSLLELIQREHKLEWRRCIKIGMQICAAMNAAHAHNVVHRDLKPGNIMLLDAPETDFVKIVDFGLAKIIAPDTSDIQRLTQTGVLVGSLQYMSPEQFTGGPVDRRTDIYALACVLYECISGQHAYNVLTPVGLMAEQIVKGLPPRISLEDSDLPPALERVIFKGLAKDPELRYQTMDELRLDLGYILSDEPGKLTAGIISTKSFAQRAKERSPLFIVCALTLTACIVLVATGFLSDPGFAAPASALMRAFPETSNSRFAEAYGQWLEEHGKPKGAEIILSTLVHSLEANNKDSSALVEPWLHLAKLQFELNEPMIACASLRHGLLQLDNLSSDELKKRISLRTEIGELISKYLSCSRPPAPDKTYQNCLSRLSQKFSALGDTVESMQFLRLVMYASKVRAAKPSLVADRWIELSYELYLQGRMIETEECLKEADACFSKRSTWSSSDTLEYLCRKTRFLAGQLQRVKDAIKNQDETEKFFQAKSGNDVNGRIKLRILRAYLLNLDNKPAESIKLYKETIAEIKRYDDLGNNLLEATAQLAGVLKAQHRKLEAKQELESTFAYLGPPHRTPIAPYFLAYLQLIDLSLDFKELSKSQTFLQQLPELVETMQISEPGFLVSIDALKMRIDIQKHDFVALCTLMQECQRKSPETEELAKALEELSDPALAKQVKPPWQQILEASSANPLFAKFKALAQSRLAQT